MNQLFGKAARAASNLIAQPFMFLLALLAVCGWAIAGPFVHFSENWQLVINTSTTILTFLMVFLLQNTQNHDTRAIHVKLDELLRAITAARTEMVGLENMDDDELAKYAAEFKALHIKACGLLTEKVTKERRPGAKAPAQK